MLAQFEVDLPELLPPLGRERVDDAHAVQGEPEGGDLLGDLGGVAEERQVHDVAQAHDLRRAQDPLLRPLGEHDVAAPRTGAAEQVVLEHQRRDARGAHHGDALLQPGPVDARLEDAERPRDLPRAPRVDPGVDGGDRGRRREGVRLHREDGHGGAPQPSEEALHLGRGLEPAREDDPRDPRVRRGRVGGERPEDDVGAVAGGDDEAPLLEVVEEVGQLHRGHLVVQHLPLEPLRVPVQHLGAERPAHLADRRLVEERVRRQDEDRRAAGEVLPERGGHGCRLGGRHPVDDHREHVAAVVRERVRQPAHGDHDLRGGPPLSRDHRQQRRAEVPGDLHVELELHRRLHRPEVGARADDEVAFPREAPVALEDPGVEFLLLPGGDEFAGDRGGDAAGRAVTDRGAVPARDERRQPVGLPALGDEGAEETHLPAVPREQLHDAEHDEGLAAPGTGPADVYALGHSSPML